MIKKFFLSIYNSSAAIIIFPIILFEDTVTNFIDLKNPREKIKEQIEYIFKYQVSDGGISYWPDGNRESHLYVSLKFAKLLHFAKDIIGSKYSKQTKKLLSYISSKDNLYHSYLRCYSLYVQSLYKKDVLSNLYTEFKNVNKHKSAYKYGFIGLAAFNLGDIKLANNCYKEIKKTIVISTKSVEFADFDNSYYFNSKINEMSLYLMLADSLNKHGEIKLRIVNSILKSQKRGYWENTVTTGWVIQAFAQVFKNESGENTNYTALVNVDNNELVNQPFKGLSKGGINKTFSLFGDPLKNLKRNALYSMDISKEGEGALYYTSTITYGLPMEIIPAREEGFSLLQEIYTKDGKQITDLTKLVLGETYIMKVKIASDRKREYVVARIPIPSGAEIIDSSFVTSSTIEEDKTYRNQTIFDNEVRYKFNHFYRGLEEVQFYFRVTSPGIFPTPPGIVECMYEEEVFGRTQGFLYIISPDTKID